ncbi:MAG: ORF6N domain-containing protein [Candidatus Omnitrophota bacterium]|nr:ORF6N domain-containing protein [Candidatus Omnitrophota bacterium]
MSKKEITVDIVVGKILVIRGKKVILDKDLAELYGVPVKRLNEQVKRNRSRFPEDFMYQLTKEEFANLKSQNATSSWGGVRKRSFVFTEQGVAMLSSVLNSELAIQVNIAIMRAFVKIRQVLLANKELAEKLEELERKYQLHETDIQVIFEAIKKLIEPPDEPPKPRFGMN